MKSLSLFMISAFIMTGCAVDMAKVANEHEQKSLAPKYYNPNNERFEKPQWQQQFDEYKRQHQNIEKNQ